MIFEKLIRSGTLTQGDLAVINYITQHPSDAVHMTSRQLADAAFVSPATVVRLSKKAGFESFNNMKVRLAREQGNEESYELVDADFPRLKDASTAQVVRTVSSMRREAVRKTELLITGFDWEPILAAVDGATGISVYAIGYSLDACTTFVRELTRLGWHVRVIGEESDAREWASTCPRGEFSIMVSYGGTTPPTIVAARILASRGLTCVSVCANGDSALARATTWNIPIAATEHRGAADRIAHTQSTVAQEYALDCLFSLIFARHYLDNARTISSALDRQGIRVHRDAMGDPLIEVSERYESLLDGGGPTA